MGYSGAPPAEVMYQHQRAPLPLEQLAGVPQQVVSLMKVLLEKDPRRRFQNPAEVLKGMTEIANPVGGGPRIPHQRVGQMSTGDSSPVTFKPQARLGPEKISIDRLPITNEAGLRPGEMYCQSGRVA